MSSLMRNPINRREALAVGTGGLLAAASGMPARAADANQRLVLKGVTIVDTHDGTLARNMTIVIADGKIVRIAAAGVIPADRSARTIDLSGTFVVPSYNDLHAHPLTMADPEGALTLMLANGITGVRQLSGSPAMLAARAQGTLVPAVEGPALLDMPGTTLAGPNARSPEVAVAEVRQQKAQGADYIKFIDMPPDVFFAAAAECTKQGLHFSVICRPA